MVRLEISGPNLPNLSFYDLPGVINVSDVPEESYLVDLVKNLVKQYIKADNCINLLALPMTDDPANSSASRLIREEAAESRTGAYFLSPLFIFWVFVRILRHCKSEFSRNMFTNSTLTQEWKY